MQIQVTNVARTDLAIAGVSSLPMSYKPNAKGEIKTGSMARVIRFATAQVREDVSVAMYNRWLANGHFRPIVQDAVDAIVPKSAQPFVMALIPNEGINREQFVALCRTIVFAVTNTGKEPKGQKRFFFDLCKSVVNSADADEGNGNVVSEQ